MTKLYKTKMKTEMKQTELRNIFYKTKTNTKYFLKNKYKFHKPVLLLLTKTIKNIVKWKKAEIKQILDKNELKRFKYYDWWLKLN